MSVHDVADHDRIVVDRRNIFVPVYVWTIHGMDAFDFRPILIEAMDQTERERRWREKTSIRVLRGGEDLADVIWYSSLLRVRRIRMVDAYHDPHSGTSLFPDYETG